MWQQVWQQEGLNVAVAWQQEGAYVAVVSRQHRLDMFFHRNGPLSCQGPSLSLYM